MGRRSILDEANTTDPFKSIDAGVDGQVVKNQDNSYTLTFKDGRVQDFDSAGRLIWQKDRNGNQTTLNYNANGQLVSITDPSNRTLTLVLPTTNGTINQISDSMGTVADYVYDTTNPSLLKQVVYPDGSKYKFEYTTINAKTYLTTVKDALDNILETHAYDSQGRATTSEKQGGVEKYTLDYSNWVPSGTSFTKVTFVRAAGETPTETKYYFDNTKARNVVTKTEGVCSCGGSNSEITQFFYDDKLNLVKKVDALSNETLYTYDSNQNLITQQSKSGSTIPKHRILHIQRVWARFSHTRTR